MSSNMEKLKQAGAKVTTRYLKEFTNVDICVRTPAIKDDNKYISILTSKRVPILDRAEALSNLCRYFKCVIAVAGTHGKSTTSALIFHILRESGYKVSCHIGADIENERFRLGDDYLVVEACEYNRSFLCLNPDIVVVTNVEPDHLDTYRNMFELRASFLKFIKKAKRRFVFNTTSNKIFTKIKNVQFVDIVDRAKTSLIGEYNQQNIALASSVCISVGVGVEDIERAVASFGGVKGRNEYIGEYKQAKVFIDYAHHPTEIESFYSAFYEDGCQVVFQPHTYSRTKYLLTDFVRVLSGISNLIIYKEYPAREDGSCGVSAYQLYERIRLANPLAKYAKSAKTLKKMLVDNNKIAFVGAGDISRIAKNILTNLTKSVDKT